MDTCTGSATKIVVIYADFSHQKGLDPQLALIIRQRN